MARRRTPTPEQLRADGYITAAELIQTLLSRGVRIGRNEDALRYLHLSGVIDPPIRAGLDDRRRNVLWYRVSVIDKIQSLHWEKMARSLSRESLKRLAVDAFWQLPEAERLVVSTEIIAARPKLLEEALREHGWTPDTVVHRMEETATRPLRDEEKANLLAAFQAALNNTVTMPVLEDEIIFAMARKYPSRDLIWNAIVHGASPILDSLTAKWPWFFPLKAADRVCEAGEKIRDALAAGDDDLAYWISNWTTTFYGLQPLMALRHIGAWALEHPEFRKHLYEALYHETLTDAEFQTMDQRPQLIESTREGDK